MQIWTILEFYITFLYEFLRSLPTIFEVKTMQVLLFK